MEAQKADGHGEWSVDQAKLGSLGALPASGILTVAPSESAYTLLTDSCAHIVLIYLHQGVCPSIDRAIVHI